MIHESALTAEVLRADLEYSPDTGIFVWIRASGRGRPGAIAGSRAAFGSKWYHEIGIRGRSYRRSRLAWLYMTGSWPPQQIDHINGNSLDDRWINLRPATPLENARNIKHRRKQSNLPMGVRLLKGRFLARIHVNKEVVYLGGYATPDEASAVYQQARRKYYGEFA